jgi:hypothetical protein
VRAPGSSSDPRKPRGRVMQAKLKRGDVTVTGDYSASRAEVYGRIASRATPPKSWPDAEGATRWYGFDLYVPSHFCTAVDTKWMTITQWKGLNGGSPPVALEVRRNNLVLRRDTAHPSLGPLTPGHWTRIVVGIHLSPNKDGWVSAYRDGRRIVGRDSGPTMDAYYKNGTRTVDPIYLKQGIYRSSAWKCTQTLYFGPITIGDSLGAVQR